MKVRKSIIMENGLKMFVKDKEFMCGRMEINIKESGRMISVRVEVL